MTRQHTYLPLSLVYIARNPQPRCQGHSAKGVSQIHPPVSGVTFSNNILISQVRVNIEETEDGITFEIS